MPTTKRRVSMSVPSRVGRTLQRLAKRNRVSVASTALDLVEKALEFDEDVALLSLAKKREAKKAPYVTHEKAWA